MSDLTMTPISVWTDVSPFADCVVAFETEHQNYAPQFGYRLPGSSCRFGIVSEHGCPYIVRDHKRSGDYFGHELAVLYRPGDGISLKALCSAELEHASLTMRRITQTEFEALTMAITDNKLHFNLATTASSVKQLAERCIGS